MKNEGIINFNFKLLLANRYICNTDLSYRKIPGKSKICDFCRATPELARLWGQERMKNEDMRS